MNNVIYIDILLLINIFINYFLLLATSFILHTPAKKIRIILTAFVGSLFSLFILLPPIPLAVMFFARILIALLLVIICFGYKTKKALIKQTFVFFLVNFIFAGIMMAVWTFMPLNNMYYKNYNVYFQIPTYLIMICTLLAFFIIKITGFFLAKSKSNCEIYNVLIGMEGKNQIVTGFVDSGNSLVETFSGLPVIVVNLDAIKDLIPSDLFDFFLSPQNNYNKIENHKWKSKIRLIPFNVVDGEGIMAGFRPDKIQLTDSNNKKTDISAFVAVTASKIKGGDYEALIPNIIK